MFKLSAKFRSQKGFTMVEAIVAISIFLIVIATATGMFTDAFASKRKAELSRMLYEESRIALERVVKEVRRGTIDYEEYYSKIRMTSDEYGKNYGEYAAKFYRAPTTGDVPTDATEVTRLYENVGENGSLESALDANLQAELYLITAEGNEKTVIKVESEDYLGTPSNLLDDEDRLVMLKLPGRDSDGDGQINDWDIYNAGVEQSPDTFLDFCQTYTGDECTTYQFQKIQPDSIKITSLKFFIAPLEDPRKAFAKFTNDIQQQPHVTILLTAESSALYDRGIRGNLPTVTLQTTVAARAQNEVKSLNP
jgi:prepilin-type N-terminal cleavage/methylation domain-containing protein